jgi:ribonuclease III
MSASGLDEVQRRLGYQFSRLPLLLEALTHTSYLNESGKSGEADSERLEFLGDAVLNLVTGHYLVNAFPHATEGELSKLRARLVSEDALARVARRLCLGDALRLGKGEALTQGKEKPSILADALEAVLAAIYLDGGLDAAAACVKRNFAEELAASESAVTTPTDFKTELQERSQRDFDVLPQYRTIQQSGPDHEKIFEVEVVIRGIRYGSGTGRSKKEAEQLAAQRALEQLGRT